MITQYTTCRQVNFKGVELQTDSLHCVCLQIRLRPAGDDWLHTGSVVCPPCDQLCGPQQCAPASAPPRAHVYPQHGLTCAALSAHSGAHLSLGLALAALCWLRV